MKDLSKKIIKKTFKNLILSLFLLIIIFVFIESAVIHTYTFYKTDCKQVIDSYANKAPDSFAFLLGITLLSMIILPFVIILTGNKSDECCEITEGTLIKLRGKITTDKLNGLINIVYSKERLIEKLDCLCFTHEDIELILSETVQSTQKDLYKDLVKIIPSWMKTFTAIFRYYSILILLSTLYIAYTEGFHTLRIQSADMNNLVFSIHGRPLSVMEHQHFVTYTVRIIFSYILFALFYLITVLYAKIKEENSDLSLLVCEEFIKSYIKPAFIISIIALMLASVIHICIFLKFNLGVKFPFIYPIFILSLFLTLMSVIVLQVNKPFDEEKRPFWFFWLNVDKAPFRMSSVCIVFLFYIIYTVLNPYFNKTAGLPGALISALLIYISIVNITALCSKSVSYGCKLIPSKEEIDEIFLKLFVK